MKNRQNVTLPLAHRSGKDMIDLVLSPFPKLISPQAHALFDALAFPVMLPIVRHLAKRSPRAALIMSLNVGVEGGVSFFTNYPPAVVPLISFQNHIRTGIVFAPLSMGLALLVPGIPKRERVLLTLAPLIPFLLNSLSKPATK